MTIVGIRIGLDRAAAKLGDIGYKAITLSTYAHLLERAFNADALHSALDDGLSRPLAARGS